MEKTYLQKNSAKCTELVKIKRCLQKQKAQYIPGLLTHNILKLLSTNHTEETFGGPT